MNSRTSEYRVDGLSLEWNCQNPDGVLLAESDSCSLLPGLDIYVIHAARVAVRIRTVFSYGV